MAIEIAVYRRKTTLISTGMLGAITEIETKIETLT